MIQTFTCSDLILYEKIKSNWVDYFISQNEDIKFFMSKLFYLCKIFDDDICKLIIDFSKQTSNKSYRYWTIQEISRITFHLQKGFYKNYYIDRRDVLKQAFEDCNISVPVRIMKEANNRLCIITPLLDGSIKNSVSRVALMIANGMLPHYREILLVSLDVFSPTLIENKCITTVLPYPSAKSKKAEIDKMFHDGINIHYPEGENYCNKMQDSLNAIYDFNPEVIIDISDEYSVLSFCYTRDYTVYYEPLRCSSSSLDFTYIIGLGSKHIYELSNKVFNSFDLNKIAEWSFPEYVPELSNIYTRNELGLPNDAFIIVCIGNNSTCCDNEFVDFICSLLIKHNKFRLLLIGQGAPDYLKVKYSNLIENKKVIEWGYEKNLYGICSVCDVLIRPNMSGGSGATAIAAMSGLPIAMTTYICDPSRWLGLNFSNNENYQQLMEYIQKLYEDQCFYENEKRRCMELVNLAVDSESKWNDLAKILKKGCG